MSVNNLDPHGPSKEELLQNVLAAVNTVGMGGADLTALTAAVLHTRLTHETVESVKALQETILQLDATNSRLQAAMKRLTVVGVVLAFVSAALAAIQVAQGWPRPDPAPASTTERVAAPISAVPARPVSKPSDAASIAKGK